MRYLRMAREIRYITENVEKEMHKDNDNRLQFDTM